MNVLILSSLHAIHFLACNAGYHAWMQKVGRLTSKLELQQDDIRHLQSDNARVQSELHNAQAQVIADLGVGGITQYWIEQYCILVICRRPMGEKRHSFACNPTLTMALCRRR